MGNKAILGDTPRTRYLRSSAHVSNLATVMDTPPLSVTQAAVQSGLAKRTVQYAIANGLLRAHKMPGRTGAYLISPADLTAWLDRRRAA